MHIIYSNYCMYNIKYPNQIENLNYINIDNINNGDLILFRWNKVGLLHEIISSFTHVGIVI